MKRMLFTVALVLFAANSVQASILVGTIVTSGTESLTEIQDLIDAYNADFGASLPDVFELVDKIEGQDSADFTEGNLALSDFDFFEQNDSGPISHDIFNATVNFQSSTLGVNDGFDSLDNPVMGFEQLSGPSFTYYVAKDGALGWSLWLYMDGFNPAYIDSATDGFTRGVITDTTLDYDPITRGISHLSFYSAEEITVKPIPEPASMISFAGMAICFGASCWRRQHRTRKAT